MENVTRWCLLTPPLRLLIVGDAIHTHFVALIGKWTIVGGWVKHRADKRGKVAKLKYKRFVTSLERAGKKTGWVGKRLIVHLSISATKWVWMASLTYFALEPLLISIYFLYKFAM